MPQNIADIHEKNCTQSWQDKQQWRQAGRQLVMSDCVFHSTFLKGLSFYPFFCRTFTHWKHFQIFPLTLVMIRDWGEKVQLIIFWSRRGFGFGKNVERRKIFACTGVWVRFKCNRVRYNIHTRSVAFRIKKFCLKNRTAWLIVFHCSSVIRFTDSKTPKRPALDCKYLQKISFKSCTRNISLQYLTETQSLD